MALRHDLSRGRQHASDLHVQDNRPVATKDIILTLGVMLVAGLVCQLVADTVRAPRMLVLLLAGTLLGPSVTDAIDVPLDSTGAELLLTLGVSFILFYGGLQLSVGVLSRVALELEAGANGALRVVVVGDWRPKHRHQSVANHLVDPAPVSVDDLTHLARAAVDHQANVLGITRL